VGTAAYAGHGVEIEDDVIRLRRRTLEFEHDVRAARAGSRPRPRRVKPLRPARAALAVFARCRGQRGEVEPV